MPGIERLTMSRMMQKAYLRAHPLFSTSLGDMRRVILSMMRRTTLIAVSIALTLMFAGPQPTYGQNLKGKEIIGVRFGGIYATDGLDADFGRGTEVELHFITGLGSWFGVGIALGSHNLGESKNPDKDLEFIGQNLRLKLQVYSMTASFTAMKELRRKLNAVGEVGLGMYSINGIVQSGIYEGYLTDNQFGFYAGTGLMYRITRRLLLDANFKFHYIFSGGDRSHLIYFYTGKSTTPLYQITLGIAYRTGS
jgi:hypothetical protein